MLPSTDLLSYGVVFSQMLSLVAAVDLRLYYASYTCNGNRVVCSNINARTYCTPNLWWKDYYYAASCGSCNSGMKHIAWSGAGGRICNEKKRFERRGGNNNCISQSGGTISALYGQTWNYISKRKRDDGTVEEYDDEEAETCVDTVEPDLLEIDGQFFDVNGTVPKDDKLHLYELMSSGVPLEDVPVELRVYESTYEAED